MRALEVGRSRMLAFHAGTVLADRLYERAKQEGTSVSDVIRRAIEQYLREVEGNGEA